nr:PREDICTED: protein stum homolog [Balearica regulorum gibbericeps]
MEEILSSTTLAMQDKMVGCGTDKASPSWGFQDINCEIQQDAWRQYHGRVRCGCASYLSPCKVFPAFQLEHKKWDAMRRTFVSAFTVLCGARTDLPDRHMCCVFWLNIAAALIQILTAIVMVGWIMSIFWGMDMVILATANTQPPLAVAGQRCRTVLSSNPSSRLRG